MLTRSFAQANHCPLRCDGGVRDSGDARLRGPAPPRFIQSPLHRPWLRGSSDTPESRTPPSHRPCVVPARPPVAAPGAIRYAAISQAIAEAPVPEMTMVQAIQDA